MITRYAEDHIHPLKLPELTRVRRQASVTLSTDTTYSFTTAGDSAALVHAWPTCDRLGPRLSSEASQELPPLRHVSIGPSSNGPYYRHGVDCAFGRTKSIATHVPHRCGGTTMLPRTLRSRGAEPGYCCQGSASSARRDWMTWSAVGAAW